MTTNAPNTDTWYIQGYRDGLNAYRRTLENPTNHHEYYVKGWRQAWTHRDDATPALERVLDDRARWSRSGGWIYNHEGRRLGPPDHDSLRARVHEGLAVHLHPDMTPDTVRIEIIKARRIHAALP